MSAEGHRSHGAQCDGCLMLKIVAERDEARAERDALKQLIGAYVSSYGGSLPRIYLDKFREAAGEPMSSDEALKYLRTMLDADVDGGD